MARPGITYFEVAQAATTLQQKGESPTIDLVRKILGTGSNTTIATHLRKWRIDHQPTVSALANTTLPAELLEQLQFFWDALQEKAKERTEKLEVEHAQEAEEYQQTIKTLSDQLQAVKKERDELLELSDSLQQQLDSANQNQIDSDQKQQQMLIRLEEQKQRLVDKESAINDLKEQSLYIHQNLDHFREASRQQREELILQYDSALAGLKQEIQGLSTQLNTERERSQHAILENEKNRYQTEKLSSEISWLKEQSKERSDMLKEAKMQLKKNQSQNDALNTQNTELLSESKVQRQKITQLEKAVSEHIEKWMAAKSIATQQAKQIEQLSKQRKPVTS